MPDGMPRGFQDMADGVSEANCVAARYRLVQLRQAMGVGSGTDNPASEAALQGGHAADVVTMVGS